MQSNKILGAGVAAADATKTASASAISDTYSREQLAERTIRRRAVEAIIWGIPAVNFRLYGPKKEFFDKVWTLPDAEMEASS